MAKVPMSDMPTIVPASDLPSTSDAAFSPVQMMFNAPKSLYQNTIGGLIEAVSNPFQTVTSVMDVLAGGLYNATPETLQNLINKFETDPDAQKRAVSVANAVGGDYAKTYGTVAGFKKALQDDPFRVLGDMSLVASGGATATARLPAVSSTLAKTATLTNPMTALLKTTQMAAPAAAAVTSNVLGLTTGVGPETIQMAYESGRKGATAFKENIRGLADKTEVLDQAKQALRNMRAAKSTSYQTGIKSTRADTAVLNFEPIDKAFNDIQSTLYEGNRLKVGSDELKKVNEVAAVLDEWRTDPSSHTAIGLDALKQRLDAIYPDSPSQRQAQRVIQATRQKVYQTIVDQSPEYAKTMSDYERAITLEKEIERALSLGKNSAADTALRKLTSLARNNVNANYGYRLDLAKALEQQGNADLLPAIAGQSMSSTLPRGLAPQIAGAAAIPSAIQSFAAGITPMSLLAAPFMSPRLVGEAAYGAGDITRRMSESALNRNIVSPAMQNLEMFSQQIPLNDAQRRLIALGLAKSGNINQSLAGQ
jgi:hypothetical protein